MYSATGYRTHYLADFTAEISPRFQYTRISHRFSFIQISIRACLGSWLVLFPISPSVWDVHFMQALPTYSCLFVAGGWGYTVNNIFYSPLSSRRLHFFVLTGLYMISFITLMPCPMLFYYVCSLLTVCPYVSFSFFIYRVF